MTYVQGSHHVTLSVADAQEDVDFHVTPFQLPEQFEHRRDEILGRLEAIDT
jgi:hypothetical protein